MSTTTVAQQVFLKGKKDYMPVILKSIEEAKKHPSNSAWAKFLFFFKAIFFAQPVFAFNSWIFGSFWWRRNRKVEIVLDNVYYTYLDVCIPALYGLSMGIVKGNDGSILLHNLVPAQAHTVEEIKHIGPVKYIFTGSCFHDSFVDDWRRAFPEAKLVGDNKDAANLEECFPMNGYWQDAEVANELQEKYGIKFFDRGESGFYMPSIREFADQLGVINTSAGNTVVIAPHLFLKREPVSSYFLSWLMGYQGEPISKIFLFCYVADKKGIIANFKESLEKFRPKAILAWHSRPWIGNEVERLFSRL